MSEFFRFFCFSEKRKDEDYDDETEELLVQEDDEDVYILSKISDLIHALFGTHKEDFSPHFDTLLHHFVKLLVSESCLKISTKEQIKGGFLTIV